MGRLEVAGGLVAPLDMETAARAEAMGDPIRASAVALEVELGRRREAPRPWGVRAPRLRAALQPVVVDVST